jgi:protein-S-isoprenylcysteine O-methyltransferase Ste14
MRLLYQGLIPTLWTIWLAGWIISGQFTKRVARAEGMVSQFLHTIPLGVGVILLTFRHSGGPWLATRIYPQSPWSFWTGAALVAFGLGFAAWARIHLAGNWSGTVTLKRDHSLTRSGPYRLVRHPIYTGLLIAILGSGIATAEWRGLVAFVLVLVAFLRKIAVEEQFLTEQFGDAFVQYRAEVPALLPWRLR